ncbi:unnamed protein product [Meloidogyne enterolobii]|uniref:Uncharacterized protein n=1 Tax=Meloidogyne enterolobii TaxID=390850 RepID=A0ACB0YXE4_MELEN
MSCNSKCVVNFVQIKNKWSEIDAGYNCCKNNCLNTKKLIGNCNEGNGFVNLIDDENVKYIKYQRGSGGKLIEFLVLKIFLGFDKIVLVYAENSFNRPESCFDYSLYYFEIKCKREFAEDELYDSKIWMFIGLKNSNTNDYIFYSVKDSIIRNKKDGEFKLSNFNTNDDDIFGCGLVYPPNNKELPYIFFTQNGEQIGKRILLKDIFDSYKPYVKLKCYSVEANFGSDLETKPFIYEISEHLTKEFH